jgi:hypothetical protein
MSAKRTSAQPRVIDGAEWTCWHVGILQYQWRSECGRATASRWSYKTTCYASVDGVCIGSRYQNIENAMKAATKALKKGVAT